MQTDVHTTGGSARATSPGQEDAITVASTAPGQLRVIKRNGAVVAYDESKISVAITKAYLAVEGGNAAASTRIHESVAQLGRQITAIFKRRMPSGGTIHIEDIQDQVELALMRTGEHKVARSYVIYRADHAPNAIPSATSFEDQGAAHGSSHGVGFVHGGIVPAA